MQNRQTSRRVWRGRKIASICGNPLTKPKKYHSKAKDRCTKLYSKPMQGKRFPKHPHAIQRWEAASGSEIGRTLTSAVQETDNWASSVERVLRGSGCERRLSFSQGAGADTTRLAVREAAKQLGCIAARQFAAIKDRFEAWHFSCRVPRAISSSTQSLIRVRSFSGRTRFHEPDPTKAGLKEKPMSAP